VRTRQPGTKKSAKPKKATPGYHPLLAVQKARQQPGGKAADDKPEIPKHRGPTTPITITSAKKFLKIGFSPNIMFTKFIFEHARFTYFPCF
jgi:hypothetical protein